MFFMQIPCFLPLRMLLLALPLFLGTFLFAICMLIIYHNEFKHLKGSVRRCNIPKITELPLITPTGQIINTVEELDMHLELLKTQVEEKEKDVEVSKSQLMTTEENLKRLTDTTNEIKKYYMKLKSEINKNEHECKELHLQIEDCLERQARLKDEVNQNVKYFSNILGNMESVADNQDFVKEYEMVSSAMTTTPKKKF